MIHDTWEFNKYHPPAITITIQLLCADPVTNPLWDAAHLASAPCWQDLLPVVDYRVGWVVIYPKARARGGMRRG